MENVLLESCSISPKISILLITIFYSLNKLTHYVIREIPLLWFQSYLSNRQQFVTYNGISPSVMTVKCGVPQGSILGPPLSLICINDLANVCAHCLPISFADDTNIFVSGVGMFYISEILSMELVEWSQ